MIRKRETDHPTVSDNCGVMPTTRTNDSAEEFVPEVAHEGLFIKPAVTENRARSSRIAAHAHARPAFQLAHGRSAFWALAIQGAILV
jgi:hypothetical protein